MATADTTGWPYQCAHGGTIQLGVWTSLTATFKATTGIMTLYVNGVETATTTHTSVPNGTFTGPLQIGDYLNAATRTAYYSGQIADIHTYNQVVIPTTANTPDGYYQPITPTRFLDTRTTNPIPAQSAARLQITGTHTIPTTAVTAVAANITVTNPTTAGIITAYPDGTPNPITSNVNYTTNQTVANSTIVPVGTNGYTDFFNGATTGTTNLIVDVTGYFTTTPTTTTTTYTPLNTPARFLNTLNGTGAPQAKLAPGATLAVTIAGIDGVETIAHGLTAVAINLTTTNETGNGVLTTYPDGTTQPGTSNLNYPANTNIANSTIAQVGTDGKIAINNTAAATDVLADVTGYFTTSATGQKYHPLTAIRLLDTRQTATTIPAQTATTITQPTTVAAANPTLILNVTETNATSSGDLIAYPGTLNTHPGTSNLNYTANTTVPGLALTYTGQNNNTFNIYNESAGTTALVIDAYGYFANY